MTRTGLRVDCSGVWRRPLVRPVRAHPEILCRARCEAARDGATAAVRSPAQGAPPARRIWRRHLYVFSARLHTGVKFPLAFDNLGFPIQTDGSSTVVPGLHFMGVHFQRKRKSATFLGVAEDAAVLAERIVGQQRSR